MICRRKRGVAGMGSKGGTVPALSFEPLNILGKANMRQLPLSSTSNAITSICACVICDICRWHLIKMAVLCKFHVYDRQFAKRTSARGTPPSTIRGWAKTVEFGLMGPGKERTPSSTSSGNVLQMSWTSTPTHTNDIFVGCFSAFSAYTLVQGITIVLWIMKVIQWYIYAARWAKHSLRFFPFT